MSIILKLWNYNFFNNISIIIRTIYGSKTMVKEKNQFVNYITFKSSYLKKNNDYIYTHTHTITNCLNF